MVVLPMVDANVFASISSTLDFPIAKNTIGLRQTSQRLVDMWSIFQGTPQGLQQRSTYMGLGRSPFTTNRGLMTLDAISSKKKHDQSYKINDLDKDGYLLTEDDLQHKPLGFGQGKSYDTSLEDKLLEQIERDKAAQAAALVRRKSNAASKNNSKGLVAKPTLKHPETVCGIKVWVGDLPKKRNIDRDLWSAFRHIPGLLDISPTVVGNEKTRDPVCKGFGFLTFDTLDHAESFISSFQGQPVSFGKVKKQLAYRLKNLNGAEVISSSRESSSKISRLRVRDKGAVIVADSEPRREFGLPGIADQGILVEAMQEKDPTQSSQPSVEVIHTREEIGSIEEYDESSEEDSDDDFDLGDGFEIEISSLGDVGDLSKDVPYVDRLQGVEDEQFREAERRIEELEDRLRKKLENAGFNSRKDKDEGQVVKPRGFKSRNFGAQKRSSPKGNNVAAVTHGLKKRERECMAGVLEKYGRSPSTAKP